MKLSLTARSYPASPDFDVSPAFKAAKMVRAARIPDIMA